MLAMLTMTPCLLASICGSMACISLAWLTNFIDNDQNTFSERGAIVARADQAIPKRCADAALRSTRALGNILKSA